MSQSTPVKRKKETFRPRAQHEARFKGNSHNSRARLSAVVPAQSSDGNLTDGGATKFHPIAVIYNEQVVGVYETGDGSADIGDPDQRDALFFSLSLDNGETWKKQQISASEDKTSTQVTWNGTMIDYKGHTQKPKMAAYGNNILLAWHDKYCPSGNPFNLAQDANDSYPSDVFAAYEVPFSGVWTARGVLNENGATDGSVTWRAPMRLNTGKRDSNHIWVEGSEVGFAMAWQEDTTGLRSGKGEGPGDGWSGATPNHGTDIWYSSIKMEDFEDVNDTDDETSNARKIKVRSTRIFLSRANRFTLRAFRLTIGTQIDSCDADRFTFAFLRKQSFEAQGASSDMFVRVNNGFNYGSFFALDGRTVTNVSSQEPHLADENITDYVVARSTDNLDDNTYDDSNDNTFSPRIILRGNNVYTGFAYTSNDVKTSSGKFRLSRWQNDLYRLVARRRKRDLGSKLLLKPQARVFSTRAFSLFRQNSFFA